MEAYTCGNCQCIDQARVCDGVVDCDTDELNCPCAAGQYTCNDGSCIDGAALCDGTFDCANHEDELHPSCSTLFTHLTIQAQQNVRSADQTTTTTVVTSTVTTCTIDMIHCDDGTCAQGYYCDNVVNCGDGSDERNCNVTTTSAFHTLFD